MASREGQAGPAGPDVHEQVQEDELGSRARTAAPSAVRRHNPAMKRTRGRSGCLNCRQRRKKCDEKKPVCSKCDLRGDDCEWATGAIFRNRGIEPSPPSSSSSITIKQRGKSGRGANEVRVSRNRPNNKVRVPGISVADQIVVDQTVDDEDLQKTATERPVNNEACASSEESHYHASAASQQQRPWIWQPSYSEANLRISDDGQHTQSPVIGSVGYAASRPDSNIMKDKSAILSSNGARGLSPLSLPTLNYTRPTNAVGLSPPNFRRNSVNNQHTAPANDTPVSLLDERDSSSNPHSETIDAVGNTEHGLQTSGIFNDMSDSYLPFHAADLDALDYLITNPTNASLISTTTDQIESLTWSPDQRHEIMPESGIMVEPLNIYTTNDPNPAYQELHTVLHNYMVQTARATGLTRQTTPTVPSDTASTGSIKNKVFVQHVDRDRATLEESRIPTRLPESAKLTNRRELELWQNYLDEVAIWLDMFDVERHFQLTIPLMAKSAEHLRYSILALSARQKERKGPKNSYTESLTLYQKAIELIVQELHSLETDVIASCVLLCVLEMMSSSPMAWARHLDGCSMLLQAAGISGTIGGDRQALFWCFARMDVWGGFLSDSLTKIPTSCWTTPSQSMSTAVAQFKTGSGGFDNYANYAVFLCASVVNLLSNRGPSVADQKNTISDTKTSSSAPWKALFDLLEDWYNSRPEELRPLMSCPATLEDHQHPFPIILFGISPAVNGNQLYHASSLLMLQQKPRDVRFTRGHKSIQWHARQICGIATSNHSHGPWINALQPLWIAGKIMSHPIEHRIILDLLARIEEETGWATSWRAEDLKDYWGDMEE